MKTIRNAKTLPKIYYGLHMEPGVAEYAEPNTEPYRILIDEQAIKNMDPSFEGKPVYVEHVDVVDLSNLQNEADGYVAESFYNKADGKHWCKFIVVSDRGHEAIRSGWKLSNAYVPKSMSGGGLWHGVEYLKQVESGEYEHLAIVRNPRYENSMILTPEEFKDYNREKEAELQRLANSKGKGTPMAFNLFKREKVQNASDYENLMVELPKSKREVKLATLITNMDDMAMSEGAPMMANMEHMVDMPDGKKMNVGDLMKAHKALHDEMEAMKKPKEEPMENDTETETELDMATAPASVQVEGDKHNAEEDAEKLKMKEKEDAALEEAKKKNAADKAAKKANFDKLANAATKAKVENEVKVEFLEDQVARGRARYGSDPK